MNKKDIRKRILAVRDSIPIEEREQYNSEIRECILTHSVYKEAQIILAYASYRSEVDTMALIKHALEDGKYVFAPKVFGEDMEFWQITSMEDLKEGYRGITEPTTSISFPEWIGGQNKAESDGVVTENISTGCKVMMWMPGAVFDRERHRIGYGKGFYDRYLGRLSQQERKNGFGHSAEIHLTTVALAYSCQVLEKIPYEPHDIRPDIVIMEEEIL